MPSLTCAGRRWLSGSDDFFFTGIAIGGWNLLCTLLLWIPYFGGAACQAQLALVLGAINCAGCVSFALLLCCTMRGRILEPSARTAVVPILYFSVLQQLALLAAAIAALVGFFTSGSADALPATCTTPQEYACKAGAALDVSMPVIFFLWSFCMRWDSFGAVSEAELRDKPELYHESWAKKVRRAFCCFSLDDHSEYFDHVAGLLAYLFQGHDIVPTDILAGMSLLGSHQRRVMRERAAKIVKYDMSKCPAGAFEVSHQAVPLPPLTEADLAVVDEVAHFAKFFMATYGWALYVYRDLKCGMCKLCCATGPCCGCRCCCDSRPGAHVGDNCCGCNAAAMQSTARLQDEDVIFTSFLNDTMRPAFFVAVDRVTNSIVIAIRGTMSLQDTLTDLVATPVRMNIADLTGASAAASASQPAAAAAAATAADASAASGNGNGANVVECSVHGGILKASTNVFEALCQQGIFNLLVGPDAPHRDKKVKIIGHSLGAGCATLVTLLVRERFPDLRARTTCLAVSPPGGLLSRDLAEYTKGFIVSPFVGLDVIPRLAVHNCETTRDAVFECLSASTHNKNVILVHGACPTGCCGDASLLPDPDEVPELPNEVGERVQRLLSGQAALPGERIAAARDQRVENRVKMQQEQQQKKAAAPTSPNNNNSGATGKVLLDRAHSAEDYSMKLYPPGRLLHYALVGHQKEGHCCCGGYACGQSGTDGFCDRRIHLPLWIEADDLQEIFASPAMMLDHFPDRCQNIFEAVRHSVRAGDYAGCFDPSLTVESAARLRREFKPTCFQPAAHEKFRASASAADYGAARTASPAAAPTVVVVGGTE